MKLIVFGASGLTGREVVERALKQGHAVTAFARGRVVFEHEPEVTIAKGDVRDAASVAAAMTGNEAVVLTLGSGTLGRSDLLKIGSGNIIAAMRGHGVHRLIALGAAGAVPGAACKQGPLGRALFAVLTGTLLRNVMRDQGEMEAQLAASGLDYTVVRPARLTSGSKTGTWRADMQGLPARWRPISRADVATFMVQELSGANYLRKGVYISK